MAIVPATVSAVQLTGPYPELPTPTSIRLLGLTPEADCGMKIIPASMEVVDLRDRDVEYAALSYVWGGVKNKKFFQEDNTVLVEITENLRLALSDLRYRIREPTRLWADALCINQVDVTERNAQVAMMYRIYSAATRVMVHLGFAADNSDLVPDVLRVLRKAAQDLGFAKLGNEDFPKDSFGNCDLLAIGLPDRDSHEFLSLERLFSRPWFNRSWTLQEVRAAREVLFLCERWDAALPRSLFMEALVALKSFRPNFNISPATEARVFVFLEPGELIYTLSANRTDRCSDPRDAVYSYLGISIEADNMSLSPNYALEVASIYHQYAEHFVKSGQGIQMLYHCCREEAQSTMASWVPNWNSVEWSRTTRHPLVFRHPNLPGPEMHIGESHRVLITKGAVVDQVELVGSARPYPESRSLFGSGVCAAVLVYHTEMQHLLSRRISSTKLPYEDPSLAIWHALSVQDSGKPRYVKQALDDPDFMTFYKDVTPHVVVQDGMLGFPEGLLLPFAEDRVVELVAMTSNFASEIYNKSGSRRSCVTAGGYMGNFDPMSQPGDVVALIQGADHPFILRPAHMDIGQRAYELIGHAFILGMEDGEAWSWSGTKVEDLHLV